MYIVIVHNAIYLLYIVAQLNFDEVFDTELGCLQLAMKEYFDDK